MASVIQSGWLIFLLATGILLLLVGCVSMTSRMSTEDMTAAPLVTLTVVPFQTPSVFNYATPQAIETELLLPPPEWRTTRTSSSGVGVHDPTCYNSPNQGLMCLGQIWNQTDDTLSNVSLHVSLFGDRGQVVAEQNVSLEQQYIEPQSLAPYRAHFVNLNTNNPKAVTEFKDASPSTFNNLPLRITEERGRLVDSGRYVLTANLHNTSEKIVHHLSVIVTVLDEDNRVVGYRVQSFTSLAVGAAQPIHIEIIPQVIDAELHHILYVEAWEK